MELGLQSISSISTKCWYRPSLTGKTRPAHDGADHAAHDSQVHTNTLHDNVPGQTDTHHLLAERTKGHAYATWRVVCLSSESTVAKQYVVEGRRWYCRIGRW